MPSLPNEQPALPYPADRTATQDNLLLVGIASLLCGLFAAVHTIYLTVIFHTPVLVFDEWRVLARYIEFMTGRLSLLSFLWEDYQGHRPAVTRLLFILDAETVGGTQVLTKTISVILWVFLVALFASVHLRQRQMPWGIRLFGVGLLFLVLFPNQQIYNFGIGWNNAILANVWFSVLALHLLIKSIEKTVNAQTCICIISLRPSQWRSQHIFDGQWTVDLADYVPCVCSVPCLAMGNNRGNCRRCNNNNLSFGFSTNWAAPRRPEAPAELLYFFVTFLGIPAFGPWVREERFYLAPLRYYSSSIIFFARTGASITTHQQFVSCSVFVYFSSRQPEW